MMRKMRKGKDVDRVRHGYAGTGYVFNFVRCRTPDALRSYVSGIAGVTKEPWFDPASDIPVPSAFCACVPERVLPGVIPESVGGFLCTIHMVVTASPDSRTENMLWYHEIGHAVQAALSNYAEVYFMGVTERMNRDVTDDDVRASRASTPEFPAYCTEYLCASFDRMREGSEDPVLSGFPLLFPWLSFPDGEPKGGDK